MGVLSRSLFGHLIPHWGFGLGQLVLKIILLSNSFFAVGMQFPILDFPIRLKRNSPKFLAGIDGNRMIYALQHRQVCTAIAVCVACSEIDAVMFGEIRDGASFFLSAQRRCCEFACEFSAVLMYLHGQSMVAFKKISERLDDKIERSAHENDQIAAGAVVTDAV